MKLRICFCRSMGGVIIFLIPIFIFTGRHLVEGAIVVSGSIYPLNPYEWTSSTLGYIGYMADGQIEVNGGSQLSCYDCYVGYGVYSPAAGTLIVTGEGSRLSSSVFLVVGARGPGMLIVAQGAQVVTGSFGILGGNYSVEGSALVTGSGSKWIVNDLQVGDKGTGTLVIQQGGEVVSNSAEVGWDAVGSVTVSGSNSKWTNSGAIKIGVEEQATLRIQQGAKVVSASGSLSRSGSSTVTVLITGAGSSWSNTKALYVGEFGPATLTVEQGAQLSNSVGYIGYKNGNTQSTVLISGTGSKWTNSGNLYVAYEGFGSLEIRDGGQVSDSFGVVGYSPLAEGTVTISGSGSLWTHSAGLSVGYKGPGTLRIENGAQVSSPVGYLGHYTAAGNGTVLVTGKGSKWTNTGILYVGRQGTGALTIQQEGEVSNTAAYLGYFLAWQGTVIVSGAGSKWTNSSTLYVGYGGNGNLSIQQGGQVSDPYAVIGYLKLSDGSVTVTGSGSRWTHSQGLSVGYYGDGTLLIQEGGQVTTPAAYIAHYAGSLSTATVTGAGSKWTNTGTLFFIGRGGQGDLIISQGGQVSHSAHAYIAYAAGSSGTLEVTDSGSKWSNSGNLYIGYGGMGIVKIRNGGQVSNAYGVIGYLAGSQSSGEVEGTGACWTNSTGLSVGYYGEGNLIVSQGGQLSTPLAAVGHYPGSQGNVLLEDAGSQWTNAGALFVGREGWGQVAVCSGSRLSTASTYIGYASTAEGWGILGDSGAVWSHSQNLFVGYSGKATFYIRRGGLLSNAIGYIAYGSSSKGLVVVTHSGSQWTNSSALYVGYNGAGTLHLRGAGKVSASSVSINSQSLLSIDVAYGSLLTIDGGSGTLTNKGILRIVASAGAPAGTPFTPIAAASITGSGQCQAIGGTWNSSSRQFTPSAVITGASGSPIQINLAQRQRILVSDSATGWQLGASFLASSSSKPLTVTATAISGQVRSALESQLVSGETILSGWLLDIPTGFTPGDPIYLSFHVGSGRPETHMRAWHYEEADGWEQIWPEDAIYVAPYVDFTITTLGGYAITLLPSGEQAMSPSPEQANQSPGLLQTVAHSANATPSNDLLSSGLALGPTGVSSLCQKHSMLGFTVQPQMDSPLTAFDSSKESGSEPTYQAMTGANLDILGQENPVEILSRDKSVFTIQGDSEGEEFLWLGGPDKDSLSIGQDMSGEVTPLAQQQSVPEPESLVLLALAGGLFAFYRLGLRLRRRNRGAGSFSSHR